MNLITPDGGLLFWMVLIFGIVFFLLARFGFPMITRMVDDRNAYIKDSLDQAEAARQQLKNLAEEQQALIEKARVEQAQILKEAAQTRVHIIAAAEEEARKKGEQLLEKARTEIAAEKESALRDIRREVAELSVGIAEKVVRKDLSSEQAQLRYLDRLVDEIGRAQDPS